MDDFCLNLSIKNALFYTWIFQDSGNTSATLNSWGRNGFDGDKEAQVAYQAPAGL
jgi:hypothetical protein